MFNRSALQRQTARKPAALRPIGVPVSPVAAVDSRLSSPHDVLSAQRTVGNRAVTSVQRKANAGGELDSTLSAEINRTRGGGSPLPIGLRGPLEQSFGSNFSGVRVHTDQQADTLNRSVQAKAFTLGSDIYFRKGNYQPGTSGGQELLAHELTHVVQQGGSSNRVQGKLSVGPASDRYEQEADRVAKQVTRGGSVDRARPGSINVQRSPQHIQRAMGFEFETGWVIEREIAKDTFTPLKKMDVVKDYGNGLKMEADERGSGDTVVEMVVDPPVQEDQPKKFDDVIKKFVKVGDAFMDVRKKDTVMLNKVSGLSGPSGYRVKPYIGGFLGNPQITGGIRFDQLFKFIKAADSTAYDKDDPHRTAKAAITGKIGQGRETASIQGTETEVNRINGSKELKGLVAMLSMYLNSGAGATKGMFKYAKLISNSFLSRTDFGAMFMRLPEEERKRFVNDRDSFVNLVLTAAGMSGTGDTKVFERGVRKSDNPKSPDYTVDATNDAATGLNIKRQVWLRNIAQGWDPLSSYYMPQLKEKYLMGLGALGSKTDRVGNEPLPPKGQKPSGSGIILEFRNMAESKDYDKFAVTAKQMFDYLVALNQE